MEGLHGACGYELCLNLFYPAKDRAARSRRYRVVPVRRFALNFRLHGPSIFQQNVVLTSNFREDLLRPSEFIVVFYRDRELLINREILGRNPTAPYRPWANKPVPAFDTLQAHDAGD